MNKLATAIGIACLAVYGQAQAENTVQLYGLLDTGFEYLSNSKDEGSVSRMPVVTGGQMASRFGMRGTEDLGDGLKAVFTLEAGLSLSNGESMQSGRMFGRQSFIGLSSADWGTIALGRQYLMSFYSLHGADRIGPAVYGLGSLDAYIPNNRVDNAITYRGTFGAWTVGALYSTGRDGSAPANCSGQTTGSGCHAMSALLRYQTPEWGVALAYDRLEGGPDAKFFFGQPGGYTYDSDSRDSHTFLTVNAKWGDTALGAGWIHRVLKAQPTDYRSDQYFISASQPLSQAMSVDAIYTYLRGNRTKDDASLISARLNYNLSKRTALYALAGHVFNQSAVGYSVSGGTAVPVSPGLGKGQTGVMLGMRHNF